jgi:ParB-like chromosome segregation protein Spo0J
MTAEEMSGSQEFMYLPLGKIMVEEQIRTGIDTESEPFKALMESIKDRGVLEPLLVTPKDGNYLLLCGERRFLATQKLGLETIPVRVMDAVTQKDEILALQLTEYRKVKRDLSGMKPKPLTKQHTSLRSIKTVITKGAGKYAKADLEKLLNNLQELCSIVEDQVQAADLGKENAGVKNKVLA